MNKKKIIYPTSEEKIKIVSAYHKGERVARLSEIFGYTKAAIYKWILQYKVDKNLTRKKSPGSGKKMILESKIGKKILDSLKKPASTYGFETDLWNTLRIQLFCKEKYGINLSRMAIWRFLNKHDQSFKKVQKQYYEVDKKKQEEWVRTTLEEIKKIIKKYKAILYFEDESNIQLSPEMGKSWGPIGEKIVHKVTGNKGSVSAISAISNDGKLLFSLFDNGKRFTSDDIILFLKKMLDYHPRRHLVVVMDQAPCHKSKKVKIFEKHQKRLHLFYLPPRSPEYNPDEEVWGHLKNHGLKSHMEKNVKGLRKLVSKKMKQLSKNQSKISGLFKKCEKSFLYV